LKFRIDVHGQLRLQYENGTPLEKGETVLTRAETEELRDMLNKGLPIMEKVIGKVLP